MISKEYLLISKRSLCSTMTFFSLTNSSSAVHFLIVIPLLPSMLPQQSNGSFPMFPYPNTYFDILFILSIGIYGNVWYSAAKNVILLHEVTKRV